MNEFDDFLDSITESEEDKEKIKQTATAGLISGEMEEIEIDFMRGYKRWYDE